MDNKITAVTLESIDRPDFGKITFSLYSAGAYILQAMDGWSAISSIDTVATPYQLRNGSDVSNPNHIGGKLIGFIVHVIGENETQTIRNINAINSLLQTQMRLRVTDDGVEYMLDAISMMSGSYNQTRHSPTYYTLEFGVAAGSAYRVRTEIFERIISAGGAIISGGIIYPTFTPLDDVVSYPDYDTPYNTITSVQEGRIVIDGNGELYPKFYIVGKFQWIEITYTDSLGRKKIIRLSSDAVLYHEWWIDNESLEVGYTTPNITGETNFDDMPEIEQADWFSLKNGQNTIAAKFDPDGEGTVLVKWQERYL